jgi:CheY-like chemotaxis protein
MQSPRSVIRQTARRGVVFVVDDDPDVVELLEEILLREGYVVSGFTDPIAALAMVGSQPPDLILLDCIMPGIDGGEFMKALEQDGIHTPIVLLTALSDPNFCVDTARAVVINKPFDVDALLAEVERSMTAQGSGAPRRRALHELNGSV